MPTAKGGKRNKQSASVASFSDENKSWLKPKKRSLFEDDEPAPRQRPGPSAVRKRGSAALSRPLARGPRKGAAAAPGKRPPAAEVVEESEESDDDSEEDVGDEYEGADSVESGEEEAEDEKDEDEDDDDDEEEEEEEAESGGDESGGEELAFERKARKTVARMEAEAAEQASEQRGAAASFTMPTGPREEMPDIGTLKSRIADVVDGATLPRRFQDTLETRPRHVRDTSHRPGGAQRHTRPTLRSASPRPRVRTARAATDAATDA